MEEGAGQKEAILSGLTFTILINALSALAAVYQLHRFGQLKIFCRTTVRYYKGGQNGKVE